VGKVTSKLQLTLPKAIAEQYGIRPGDEVTWEAAGDVSRVIPPGRQSPALPAAQRLALFDAAQRRQRQRQKTRGKAKAGRDRGWSREDLYRRGRAG
jgi:bifunctional DNA-binding transcriptional regulator/antitoxin component of YhaV-PrlF toxin-antitoxin module